VRTRGHFPTDEAAIKLLYLVLRQVAQTWKTPPQFWRERNRGPASLVASFQPLVHQGACVFASAFDEIRFATVVQIAIVASYE
jgi:hypothetical protein